MKTNKLRSIIPLLTIARGGTTVRVAANPFAVTSRQVLYLPFPFVLNPVDTKDGPSWKRVELLTDTDLVFPAPFPGEGLIAATVRLVPDEDHDYVLHEFRGCLEVEGDRIYFQTEALEPPV